MSRSPWPRSGPNLRFSISLGGHTCVSSDRSIRAKFICGRKPWILPKIKMWRAALSVEPVKGRFLCTRTDSWVLTHAEGPACASTHVCKHTRASSPWGPAPFPGAPPWVCHHLQDAMWGLERGRCCCFRGPAPCNRDAGLNAGFNQNQPRQNPVVEPSPPGCGTERPARCQPLLLDWDGDTLHTIERTNLIFKCVRRLD